MENNNQILQELKNQLEEVMSAMPQTFTEQRNRDKAAAGLNFQIMQLEEPQLYERNRAHFDNYEVRM